MLVFDQSDQITYQLVLGNIIIIGDYFSILDIKSFCSFLIISIEMLQRIDCCLCWLVPATEMVLVRHGNIKEPIKKSFIEVLSIADLLFLQIELSVVWITAHCSNSHTKTPWGSKWYLSLVSVFYFFAMKWKFRLIFVPLSYFLVTPCNDIAVGSSMMRLLG